MNEFIEQFLLETRELVEQATGDLLALEENPGDQDRLDGAFRAFHTLKGAAGIVDFAAMARALHAAEDVLSQIRAGEAPVTPALISDGLFCLDQVVRWLDDMGVDGEPPVNAEADADAIVTRFAGVGASTPPPTPVAPISDTWPRNLFGAHAGVASQARAAVRYTPEVDCFFRGEDPAALMAGLPGLLVLDLEPSGPWPVLDAFDPFVCRLVFSALSSASVADLSAFLRPHGNHVEVHPVNVATADGGARLLSPDGRTLLEAQVLLLAETAAEGRSGRLAAAGRVAANVLRHTGCTAEADDIEQALIKSQMSGDAGVLASAIQARLSGWPITDINRSAANVASPERQEAGARMLRVDLDRVDALVKLIGELTVLKNAFGHTTRLVRDGAKSEAVAGLLRDQHGLLERLTAELQQSVLSIRLLPLRHVFQRFPRLVREMGRSLGKSVRLVGEGDATEADKAIVESLFEPLLHMLRNAVDHGAESERERLAAGKPPVTTIHLRGMRQGDQVCIEVEDDGRGIDVAQVRRVAVQRGIASAEMLAAMSDEDVAELIFAPGFSTVSKVTGLSGRGVGMDAVRTSIGRLGGRVTLVNRPGQGTMVRLAVPFTVMMTRLMTVEANGQVFGIPMDAVAETVKVARDRITPMGAARAFVLRDRTVPLINLAEILGEPPLVPPTTDANVVVVAIGGQLGSLEVDRIGERIDVMLKPIDGLLSGMLGIAGTTLMGDGRVLIVLDLQELIQ